MLQGVAARTASWGLMRSAPRGLVPTGATRRGRRVPRGRLGHRLERCRCRGRPADPVCLRVRGCRTARWRAEGVAEPGWASRAPTPCPPRPIVPGASSAPTAAISLCLGFIMGWCVLPWRSAAQLMTSPCSPGAEGWLRTTRQLMPWMWEVFVPQSRCPRLASKGRVLSCLGDGSPPRHPVMGCLNRLGQG